MVPMNELQKTFRKALSYVLNIFTSHYTWLIPFRYYVDELTFGLEFLLQSFYISRNNSTYAEHFYGFKRSHKTEKGLKDLKPKQKALVLIFETVLPFVKLKIQKKMEQSTSEIKKKIWSYINFIIEGLIFFFQLRYLLVEKFNFFKPYFYFFSIIIRRPNNYERQANRGQSIISKLIQKYNIFGLFILMKFLEWYFSD